jgi:hypothetical protein
MGDEGEKHGHGHIVLGFFFHTLDCRILFPVWPVELLAFAKI